MSTNDMDDILPRPSPRPSQLEEVCIKPQVPEVSLLFDYGSGNLGKTILSNLPDMNYDYQTNITSDANHYTPRLEHHYSPMSSPKSPTFPTLTNTALKTPLKLDDRGVLSAKKVSFSPHSSKNDPNTLEETGVECQSHKNEMANCHCNRETIKSSQYGSDAKVTSDGKRSVCFCSSCSSDSINYSCDHSNSFSRVMKNWERKINTKVSYDDLQKTELKIENILLKHKYKYDKLGENCVSKEEFNRVVKIYDTQINILQSRLEELTKKLEHSLHFIGTSCNHEIKKCSCKEERVSKTHPAPVVDNVGKCFKHNCYLPCTITSEKMHSEIDKNYKNDDVVSCKNHAQFNVQSIRSDNKEKQLSICRESCCDHENFKINDHRETVYNVNPLMENHVIQMRNAHVSTENRNQAPLPVLESNANELISQQPQRNVCQLSSYPQEHHTPLNERNDIQLLNAEKNVHLDRILYNNIVEEVKNLMQKNLSSSDSNADTAELIKKATVEQLQKFGINTDNCSPTEKHSPNQHQTHRFIQTNSIASPDLSFHLNSVAMKYISETSPNAEYRNKKTPANDMSFRSNCNNVSIATLQYMERYQLLPNSEQRYGGNSVGPNKYDQNVAQEHYKSYKQNKNNDRSFIY